MSIKFSFDLKGLEKELKRSIEKDLQKHPEQVLDDRKGEKIEAMCPKCGCTDIRIIAGGKGKCTQCQGTMKINLDINWR